MAWRNGVEPVGTRTARFEQWTSRIPMLIGAGILALGAVAYLVAALDPLEVMLILAERGGSPALFGVGILITIGTTLLALGALGYALRDVRLDPRTRGTRRERPHEDSVPGGGHGTPIGEAARPSPDEAGPSRRLAD